MYYRFLLLCFMCFSAFAAPSLKTMTQAKLEKYTPQKALQALQQGNKRFINETQKQRDFITLRHTTSKKGQYPHSVVLSCIDSRSDPEIVFDQGIGNIFSTSIAGNVSSVDVLAGMEYATKFVGTELILVMGHTQCGAVQAACKGIGTPNIKALTAKIKPAVDKVKHQHCDDYAVVNAIAKQNVLLQIQKIIANSAVIKKLLQEKKIDIVGAMHDIASGKVIYFNKEGGPLS